MKISIFIMVNIDVNEKGCISITLVGRAINNSPTKSRNAWLKPKDNTMCSITDLPFTFKRPKINAPGTNKRKNNPNICLK
jgi:hypothetical protein